MTDSDRESSLNRQPASRWPSIDIDWLRTDALFDDIVINGLDPEHSPSHPPDINDSIIPDYCLEEPKHRNIRKAVLVGAAAL